MPKSLVRLALTLTFIVALGNLALAAPPTIDFELLLDGDTSPTAPHEWMEVFKTLKQSNVRIRNYQPGDEPGLTQRPGTNTAYRVVGVINSENTLKLPGGVFRISDRAKLSRWIDRLLEGGTEGVTEKPGAFGLNSRQLVELHEALSVKVPFATKGLAPKTAMQKVGQLLRLEVTTDSQAVDALGESSPLEDELQGLTAGTVLAAIVRPSGLVVFPEKPKSAPVRLRIDRYTDAKESWPIGWPTEKNYKETVPRLLDFLPIEIEKTPLSETMEALQGRLKVPFLYDYNSMARQRIDPAKVRVSVPMGRSFYAKVLDRVTSQALLSWEVRLDEADQPFLWISTKIK